jgi:signal transduction histidine kinase
MNKVLLGFLLLVFSAAGIYLPAKAAEQEPIYQYKETQELVSLVDEAASLIKTKGEAIFPEFKKQGSKWRHDNTYVFILDPKGKMLLHPDPALEGKNLIGLKDVNQKFINKEIIKVATSAKKSGWVHYQWPEPGSIFPLWKTTYVKEVAASSGKKYIIGCGLYNLPMEKEFIVAVVDEAAALVQKEGRGAFAKLRDKAGPFMFLDTYVFVDTPDGVELVNAAFPNLEGRNLIDYKDSQGKCIVKDYIHLALTSGAGWIDYLWPKPGQSEPAKKHTYVKMVKHGKEIFIIGSGAYLR